MVTQGVGEDGGGGNWTTVADAPHQAPASLKRGRSKLMETGYKILRSHPNPHQWHAAERQRKGHAR